MNKTPEEIAVEEAAALAEATRLTAEAAAKKDPLEIFNEYLATLDPEVAKEIGKHTTNLKTALVSERSISKSSKEAVARLKVLEDAENTRRQDALTEVEKAAVAKQIAEAETAKFKKELTEERIKNAVLAEASKANFVDPLDAYTNIDRDSLEIDEAGKVKGVESAVKELAKKKPYLIQAAESSQYNLNGGDRGRLPLGAGMEEIKTKKRNRYRGGI
jgi:hypothetical protein